MPLFARGAKAPATPSPPAKAPAESQPPAAPTSAPQAAAAPPADAAEGPSAPPVPAADASATSPPAESAPSRSSRRLKITPTRLDRLLVVWIATALTVWLCCLVMLWAASLDPSGTTTLEAIAASLLAVSLGLRISRPMAWVGRRVLRLMRLQNVLAMDLAGPAAVWVGPDDVRAMMRLLGSVAVFCGLCGLASTMAVRAAGNLADWLIAQMLWTPWSWGALKFVLMLAGMLPIGLGVATAFLASAMVRGGSGRDPYAMVCREWLAAGGLGLVIFAGLWWLGVDLLGAALMTGVVLVAAAVVLFQRPEARPRPRRVSHAPGAPRVRPYASVAVASAAAAVGLAVQMRLVGDLAGLGPIGSALWTAASLWLLVRFLAGEDRKPRAVGRAQAMGASIGAVSGLAFQAMLGASAVALWRQGRTGAGAGLLAMAAAAQVPTLALVAVVLSRGRTILALAGGSARGYARCVWTGAGLGLLAFGLCAGGPPGRALLATLGAGVVAACAGASAWRATQPRKRVQWAAWGAALIGALGAGVAGAVRAAGPVAPGAWLTSAGLTDGQTPIDSGGLIPWRPWQAQGVSRAVTQLLARPDMQGRWWVVSPCGAQTPQPMPRGIWVMGSSVDPPMAPPGPWQRKLRSPEADFLVHTRIGRQALDGVFLAPLPADHPQAWRCYNELVLKRCRWRVHADGVMLLRTQVSPGRLGRALAVARTFHGVVGSGWAVVALGGPKADLLLAGPTRVVDKPAPGPGAHVVDLARLVEHFPNIQPANLVRPGALASRERIDPDALEAWLRSAAEP